MLRYRIARNESGRYFVLATSTQALPLTDTYATRRAAQETADGLNRASRPRVRKALAV